MRSAVVILFGGRERILRVLVLVFIVRLIQTADQFWVGAGYGNKAGKEQQEHKHNDDGSRKAAVVLRRNVG
jgi:hypothetical protein